MANMSTKHYFRLALITVALVIAVIMVAAVPVSCRLTEDGIEVLTGDVTVPKIVSYSVENNRTVSVVYSEKILLSDVIVVSEDGLYQEEARSVTYDDSVNSVVVELADDTEIGIVYYLTGYATDVHGNSLQFSLPFTGFNENPAILFLSEIRSKHTTTSGMVKKAEYVEVYVAGSGNTAGLEILAGSSGEDKKYVFPVMDVKAGEYITVHFMTNSEGKCIDELEDNLLLSEGEACSSGRDLWIDNQTPSISDNDVIVIKDNCRDQIVDAVLFSASNKTSWYTSLQKNLSAEAFDGLTWNGGAEVEWAACSDGVTSNRTLGRLSFDNIPAGKNDWAVFMQATPGEKNAGALYEKN